MVSLRALGFCPAPPVSVLENSAIRSAAAPVAAGVEPRDTRARCQALLVSSTSAL